MGTFLVSWQTGTDLQDLGARFVSKEQAEGIRLGY